MSKRRGATRFVIRVARSRYPGAQHRRVHDIVIVVRGEDVEVGVEKIVRVRDRINAEAGRPPHEKRDDEESYRGLSVRSP